MRTISKTFNTRDAAEKAFLQLESKGVPSENISLITTETAREKLFGDTTVDNTLKGAGTGAAVGGTLTAVAAGLTAVGAVAAPGVGLLASGPIVALLAGGGAGAAVGGVAGALIGAGYTTDEASAYESDLNEAGVLVSVHPADEHQALAAREVLGAGARPPVETAAL